MVKGIIFDFDRTLVYLNVDWPSVYDKLSAVFDAFRVRFNPLDALGSIGEACASLKKE